MGGGSDHVVENGDDGSGSYLPWMPQDQKQDVLSEKEILEQLQPPQLPQLYEQEQQVLLHDLVLDHPNDDVSGGNSDDGGNCDDSGNCYDGGNDDDGDYDNDDDFLTCLKFRVVQPVDIPRIKELEQARALLPGGPVAASKAILQYRQHHAAPFFRCMLLSTETMEERGRRRRRKRSEDSQEEVTSDGADPNEAGNENGNAAEGEDAIIEGNEGRNVPPLCPTGEEPKDSPHSPDHILIGYTSASRCHEYVSEGKEPTRKAKHESDGPLLAIHGIVVDEADKGREEDLKRSMLTNYIRAIEIWNGEVDEAKAASAAKKARKKLKLASGGGTRSSSPKKGKSKTPSKLKMGKKKNKVKIKKIVLTTFSREMQFYVSLGFRWRNTVNTGLDPLYQMEIDVSSILLNPPESIAAEADSKESGADNNGSGGRNKDEDCYLVESFVDPQRCGSGNSAAIVVLRGPPSKTVGRSKKHPSSEDGEGEDDYDSEEEREKKAETWMHFVAKEFQQPATAFVWRVEGNSSENNDDGSSSNNREGRVETRSRSASFDLRAPLKSSFTYLSMGGGGLVLSGSDDAEEDHRPEDSDLEDLDAIGYDLDEVKIHHCIRFYTRAGIEVDVCAHATLAAASVLFRRYKEHYEEEDDNMNTVLSFQSRKGIVLRARRAPPPPGPPITERSRAYSMLSTSTMESIAPSVPTKSFCPNQPRDAERIAMDYPWRTVQAVPFGPEGEGAVISMIRRSFFRDKCEKGDEEQTFSRFSKRHVLYMGVTEAGEDLLIELTPEGFDLLSKGRNVDYMALKQGWKSGYTRGVIVCCEVPLGKDGGETGGGGGKDESDDESGNDARPAAVVTEDGEPIHFRSRYFEPKVGVNEDPVSGWPHCALGPYFGRRWGKTRLFGMQESDRGGFVECVLKESEGKVCIIGRTVSTVEGKLKMRS